MIEKANKDELGELKEIHKCMDSLVLKYTLLFMTCVVVVISIIMTILFFQLEN